MKYQVNIFEHPSSIILDKSNYEQGHKIKGIRIRGLVKANFFRK